MVKYSPGRTKTILNKLKNIDSWFWCRYTLNPYRGCEHACVYCDGRSERNYLHDDFEGMIFYKKNAPKLLKYKLKNARNLIPDIIAAGGTCDAYQPAEKKFKITQKILKIVKKYRWPICISTKNTLIQRDLEIFDQIGKDTYAAINFSFSTVNDEIAKYFEPGASSPSERLEVINLISRQFPNINVGINYMPII